MVVLPPAFSVALGQATALSAASRHLTRSASLTSSPVSLTEEALPAAETVTSNEVRPVGAEGFLKALA